MKDNKRSWLTVPLIVVAIALYLRAHPLAPPKPSTLTVAQGTSIEIRLDRTVGSKTSASGERFTGKLAQAVTVDGKEIVPADTEFTGTVIQAVPAGTLAGGATLRVGLSSFSLDDKTYAVDATPVVRVSRGLGKRTAEMTGGGALLGAAIGALAHGGRGALIGSAVGAGTVAVGLAATNKPVDIVMPKESVLTFRLTQDVVITPKAAAQAQHGDLASVIRGLFS